MKTTRTSTAIVLFGAICAFTSLAQAKNVSSAERVPKGKTPKITTETSLIGPATERVVVTEKYKDGTVIRVVQILHKDGSSETSGERHILAPVAKS